jgi:hypothetical protein
VTSTGIHSPDGAHLHPRRDVAGARTPAGAGRGIRVARREARADDDPRRKAQLAGDEGDGGRELLVVADGGHEVVRGDGGGVGLAGQQRREHGVDARQRVSRRARCEGVARPELLHPGGADSGRAQRVAQVAARAQQRDEAVQGRTARADGMLLHPGAQARRCHEFAAVGGGHRHSRLPPGAVTEDRALTAGAAARRR